MSNNKAPNKNQKIIDDLNQRLNELNGFGAMTLNNNARSNNARNNNGPSNKQELLETLGVKIGEIKEKIDVTKASLLGLDYDEEHREFFYKEVLEAQGKLGQFESMKKAGKLDNLLPLVKRVLQKQQQNLSNEARMLQAQMNALNGIDSSYDAVFEKNLKKNGDE